MADASTPNALPRIPCREHSPKNRLQLPDQDRRSTGSVPIIPLPIMPMSSFNFIGPGLGIDGDQQNSCSQTLSCVIGQKKIPRRSPELHHCPASLCGHGKRRHCYIVQIKSNDREADGLHGREGTSNLFLGLPSRPFPNSSEPGGFVGESCAAHTKKVTPFNERQ